MKTPFWLVVGTHLTLATAIAWPVLADNYPNKPIKVISDSAPGSAIDVTFRMVMDRLGTVLGQQIVPVDQPGAGGAIAAHAASESIPDGYTFLAPALSLFISIPGKAENLPLILPRDFLPVCSLAELPMFICASAQSGIKTLRDLIGRAKQRPGEISFCGERNRATNAFDWTASGKQGRYQIGGRALYRRPSSGTYGRYWWSRAADHRRIFRFGRRNTGAHY